MRLFSWLGGPRTVVLQFAALLLISVGYAALSHGGAWVGSWKMALDEATATLWFLGPLCAGLACAVYVRIQGSGVVPLVNQSPRGLVAWAQPAIAVWVLGAAVTLLMVAGMTTAASLGGARPYYASLWIVIPALAVLAVEVMVGVVIGALGQRLWLAPVAVVATYGLEFLTYMHVLPMLFFTGGGGDMAAETFAVWPNLGQVVAGAGLAVGLLAASKPSVFALVGYRRMVVGGFVAAGLVTFLALPRTEEARWELVAEPTYTCTGWEPTVCMFAETVRPLDAYARRMRELSAPLRAVGVDVPSRFVQAPFTSESPWDPRDGVLTVWASELSRTVSDVEVTESLVTPARCAQDYGEIGPPEVSFQARHLMGRWLRVQHGLLQVDPRSPDHEWLTTRPARQAAWVSRTYELLRQCDYERLALPDGFPDRY